MQIIIMKLVHQKFLGDVATPLLLIHSKQDTLTPLRFAPFKVIENNPNIVSYFTKKGACWFYNTTIKLVRINNYIMVK